jgi:hypothetical protein
MEDHIPGKTGLFDESITLDYQPDLAPASYALTAGKSPGDDLWPFTTDQDLALRRELKLDELDLSRYSMRRGGASRDLLTNLRDRASVKARGRWESDASLKRYGKATRVLKELKKVPPEVLEYALVIEQTLTHCVMCPQNTPRPPTLTPVSRLYVNLSDAGGGVVWPSRSGRRRRSLMFCMVLLGTWFGGAGGCVAGVILETTCGSWSVARRGPIGSSWGPSRDRNHIMGLPGISPSDSAEVAMGNMTMQHTAWVIRLCNLFNVPVVLENPGSTRMFATGEISKLAKGSHFRRSIFDQCHFGARWRNKNRSVPVGH